MTLTFFETPRFIAVREEYFDDEHYRSLQNRLMKNPTRGAVIPGCGGLIDRSDKDRTIEFVKSRGSRV